MTTPAGLKQAIGFDMNWTSSLPSPFGQLLSSYLPPLLITTVNALLLSLVMYQSTMSRHDTYGAYHIQVFSNCTLYLVANIIVIPIVSLDGPVWSQLQKSVLGRIYGLVYQPKTIIFYCIIVTQMAPINALCYLLRLVDLAYSLFSLRLTHYSRILTNQQPLHFLQESDMFMYGYFHAQQLLVMLVTLLFLFESPLIVLPSLFFFLSRHAIDTYNLLAVFRKELNCSFKLLYSVLQYHVYGLYLFLLYSLGLLVYRHQQGLSSLALWLALLLFPISIYLHLHFNSISLLPPPSNEPLSAQHQTNPLFALALSSWKTQYNHPLILPRLSLDTHNYDNHLQVPRPRQQLTRLQLVRNTSLRLSQVNVHTVESY